jgi:DNA-binding protein Fis
MDFKEIIAAKIVSHFDMLQIGTDDLGATKLLKEIESALYEGVMKYTHGNQVRAAQALGISRGTLRSKLKFYFNTTKVGGRYHQPVFVNF